MMLNSDSPEAVQQAANTAMSMTATAWEFEEQDAVEAVIIKIENRTPLTFRNPAIGTLVRYLSQTIQQSRAITKQLWKDMKASAIAATGSSAYVYNVKGEFPTFMSAQSALKAHYQVRKDRHCPLRNHTVDDTLGGTGSELEELIVEMEKAESLGMAETR